MPHSSTAVIGWDIGGVNTKGARVEPGAGDASTRAISAPLEMERDSALLVPTLRRLSEALGGARAVHAVTMTAELSQAFRTKREGVHFILDAVREAFPDAAAVKVYTVDGRFLDPWEARGRPHEVAAANWAATARFVGRAAADCLLVDIGTTSTDIIPIVGGVPTASGRTDPERLLNGELVYTGALRTPVEAVARTVPLWGGHCPLAAERFALMGDVYLWVGALDASDYTVVPPDGRPATREFAGERLARAVCADAEMLDEEAVGTIARALAEAQLESVTAGMRQVLVRHPGLTTAVVAGLGDFVAAEAARRMGLEPHPLADRLGDAARTAPAAAVAWLLAEEIGA